MYRNTYVEIDTKKLENNIKNIVEYYDYKYYIGVVKSNAYGFGEGIVKYMEEAGINYFAVSNLDEAIRVRSFTKLPIMVLEPVPFDYLDVCIKNDIAITLSNYDDYKLLKDNKGIKIHLKIDSGMNRLGFTDKNIIKEVFDNLNEQIVGVYTHLSTSGINDKKYDYQVRKFKELTSLIDMSNKIVHIGRSATIINHKRLDFVNGIRLGIIMYGINNNIIYRGIKGKLRRIKRNIYLKKNKISSSILVSPFKIEQTFKLISEVIEIKNVNADQYIGYGLSCHTDKKIKIAIISVGYGDGYDIRNVGNTVLINNKEYEVLTVNSGMITVKADINVKLHDRVEVIYDIKRTALHTGQTVYTVTSSINSNVRKLYK